MKEMMPSLRDLGMLFIVALYVASCLIALSTVIALVLWGLINIGN
jgi:hypothetical protein|tara:strand:+ start:410 stop:544 length:135 start_codon:yes stop_codon:yes gene_type:complete